jgi:hypothetical protein
MLHPDASQIYNKFGGERSQDGENGVKVLDVQR